MSRSVRSDTAGLIPNRACRNCVQIKVKCTPLLGLPENVCQRCHRLGKSCTTPAPVSRKQRTKSTRVKQLEQRLDQLTALVSSRGGGQTLKVSSETLPTQAAEHPVVIGTPSVAHQAKPSSLQSETRTHPDDEALDLGQCRRETFALNEQPPAVRTGSPIVHFAQIPGRKDGSQLKLEHFCPVHLGFELESWLFEEFRNNMAKHFPFVVIDDKAPAETIRRTKPFSYWACILAASHRDPRLHPLLHDEMLKAIGHRLFVAGDKSLDMLQGLLLMAAWAHSISHLNPQLMNLLHLVQALLADRGLLKSARIHDKIRVATDTSTFLHGKEPAAVNLEVDEVRALLGFYCLSWKAALSFNRIDPMRHSQHIDSCCENLKSNSDRQSDRLVVELVHLYRIVGRFYHVDSASANLSPMYRTMFTDEIRRFRHSLPTELQKSHVLELEILGSSISILEPSYTTDYQSKVEHLDVFHNCIETGNCLVEALMNVPNDEYPNTTCLMTMTLVQIMTIFSRLSFFKSSSWDTRYSCGNVNLDLFLEKLVGKLQKIHQLEIEKYPQYQAWRYNVHAQKANLIRDWYKAKIAADQAVFDSAVDEVMPNTFSDNPFGTFDDSFWQDIMSNWNEF